MQGTCSGGAGMLLDPNLALFLFPAMPPRAIIAGLNPTAAVEPCGTEARGKFV